jgi:hypothetical protein
VALLGVVLGVALLSDDGDAGTLVAFTATSFPGTGRPMVIANATATWHGLARVASLCARRLRGRLGLRDMWAPDVDLCIGETIYCGEVPLLVVLWWRCDARVVSCEGSLLLVTDATTRRAGSMYPFLQLQHGSSSAAVLLAIVAAAREEEESRHGWATTGMVTLGGEIGAVDGVRQKVRLSLSHPSLRGATGPDLPFSNACACACVCLACKRDDAGGGGVPRGLPWPDPAQCQRA